MKSHAFHFVLGNDGDGGLGRLFPHGYVENETQLDVEGLLQG